MTLAATDIPAPRGWLAEASAMLRLALPMILTNLGQIAMTTTDVLLMGRLGPQTLAAGALGASLYHIPMMFGLGLMLATSPMIAMEIGRRKHSVRDVRRTVRQGLWLAVIISLPIWVVLWQAEPILLLLGQQPDLAALAAQYMHTLQWAVLPFYGYIVLRSFMAALERPGWALLVVVVAVAFNAVAAWCLMFGHLGFPALGIVGAGIATTIASTVMFAGMALITSMHRKFRRYSLLGRFWRSDWPRLRAMVMMGMPIGGILVFEVAVFNAAAFLMGLISEASLAAHAIAIQIASVCFMIPMGIGQAATVRVGRAHGAGSPEAVSLAGWTALAMGVGFMVVTALVLMLAPRLLISAFIDIADPANATVVAAAIGFVGMAGLFQVVDGAQAVASGMLRGLGDTGVPMLMAAVGYWIIGLPVGIVLAFWLGFDGLGVWIGLTVGLAAVSAMLIGRWMKRERFLASRARTL